VSSFLQPPTGSGRVIINNRGAARDDVAASPNGMHPFPLDAASRTAWDTRRSGQRDLQAQSCT
jgi:hypothetical protein